MINAFYTFVVESLNSSDVATTLYFSNYPYIDEAGHYHEIRLLQPSLINVSPNDGGVLTIFGRSSVGEVELANIDGELDYLADYAVDGRAATLTRIDDATETVLFTGTVGRMYARGDSLFFALKDITESLTTNHPLGDVYAGDNALPDGLEGTEDDIEGKVKPRVYGDVSNISAVPVNTSKLIYQASSKDDCLIVAVYDDGVRLTNYLINGAHSIGATSIAVDTGSGDIPVGALVMFDGHRTVYEVDTGLSGGSIVLTSGLTAAITDNSAIEVLNFYSDTIDLESVTEPDVWGSYQGYFRLGATPAGVVTCDAISVTANVLDKAGDVLAKLADEVSITADSASVIVLNAAGVVGIYVDKDTRTDELFNRVIKSVIGYYWFESSVLMAALLTAPASTADFVIEDWMIIDISRAATGIGSNGVPIYGCKMLCDRIETVQTTVAGSVSRARRQRLAEQHRFKQSIDTATQTRHLLAQKIDIESYLRSKSDAATASARLKNIGKVRRDVVDIVCDRRVLPAFTMGQTALAKKSRLGYDGGRKMVVVGYELNAKKELITLRCFG